MVMISSDHGWFLVPFLMSVISDKFKFVFMLTVLSCERMSNHDGPMLMPVIVIFFSMQNTDAALLPTISYPAFAVDDDALYSQTLDKIVRKLRGKYGFKRFLRDGYRTTNEDKNRRYYKPAEMKVGAADGTPEEFTSLL